MRGLLSSAHSATDALAYAYEKLIDWGFSVCFDVDMISLGSYVDFKVIMVLQDWANIATITASLAVIGVVFQVYLAYRQLKADHERSRREKSVDVLVEWSKNLKKEGSIARKIIECLSEEQCRELLKQQEFKISSKHQSLLAELFSEQELRMEGEHIVISEAQSSELRWHAISYLNALEFTLVAWQYAVVDKEIIESQFAYLFRPADGHELLKNFRKAANGEESYPAIEVFTAHVTEKRRRNLISKANIA